MPFTHWICNIARLNCSRMFESLLWCLFPTWHDCSTQIWVFLLVITGGTDWETATSWKIRTRQKKIIGKSQLFPPVQENSVHHLLHPQKHNQSLISHPDYSLSCNGYKLCLNKVFLFQKTKGGISFSLIQKGQVSNMFPSSQEAVSSLYSSGRSFDCF